MGLMNGGRSHNDKNGSYPNQQKDSVLILLEERSFGEQPHTGNQYR